jgi:XTP/dITP diphosphohydrolase
MKLIIASNNKHKIKEIKEMLGSKFSEIISLREAGIDHETIEDGTTFAQNAYKKAYEIAMLSGEASLADDSGICVDALGGAPGIFSARFAGGHGDDEANNRLLLQKLKGAKDRSAHYTCAISLVYPDGKHIAAEGHMYGTITENPRGDKGFGYDPLFVLTGEDRTVAEMSEEEKNALSHRRVALDGLLAKL